MRLWIDYRGEVLDIERAEQALSPDYGWWGHISTILDELKSKEST